MLLGIILVTLTNSLEAAKKPKAPLVGDCLYQSICEGYYPGSISPNETYFLTLYLAATDSAKLDGDIVVQIQEWKSVGPAVPLAIHSWAVPKELLLKNLGRWIRVGAGENDDLFTFISSNNPQLGSFTIEFGFDVGAKKGDFFLVDGVQLEKAVTLPNGTRGVFPTPWASEKGVVSPSAEWAVNQKRPYYTW